MDPSLWIRPAAACSAALALAWPAALLAADIYVDAAAPGGGDGSAAKPYNDLQTGLDVAAPGDTIHVSPGTYAPVRTRKDGAADQRIVVTAEPPREAIVAVAIDDQSALLAEHTYHTFRGLVFDGGYHHRDAVVADGADHLELVDVEVRRSDRDCVDLRTTRTVLIEASYIHHCVAGEGGVQSDAHGVTGDSVFQLTLRDTEIYMVSGDSLQLSPPRMPWDEVLVEGCLLWNAPLDEATSSLPQGAAIGENAVDTKVGAEGNGSGQPPRLRIVDTVARGWRGAITNQAAFNLKEEVDVVLDRVSINDSEIAFRLRAPAAVRAQNAVLWDVDTAYRLEDGLAGAALLSSTLGDGVGLAFQDAGGAPVDLVTRNLLFLADAVPAPADADASNLATTPASFVDAAAHDYRLVSGAAPVDAGVDLPEVTVDRLGVARPFGAAHDVGAYEYTDQAPGTSSGGESEGDSDVSGDASASTSSTTGAGSGSTGGDTGAPTTGPATSGTTAAETSGASDSASGGAGAGGGEGCGCAARDDRSALALALLALLSARRRRAPSPS